MSLRKSVFYQLISKSTSIYLAPTIANKKKHKILFYLNGAFSSVDLCNLALLFNFPRILVILFNCLGEYEREHLMPQKQNLHYFLGGKLS